MKTEKIVAIIIIMIIVLVGTLEITPVQADEYVKLEKPVIHVKVAKDGSKAKVTIEKTKGAESYIISASKNAQSNYYAGYRGELWFDTGMSIKLEKDGNKKRTVSLELTQGKYSVCVTAYNENAYEKYKESDEIEITINKPYKGTGYADTYDFSDTKVGDIIRFGTYEQDADFGNGNENIEWVVLSKNDKCMLVVSRYALDCLPYNIENDGSTWETCTLRKWLNKKFYNAAFNKTEKGLIEKVKIRNDDNESYNTDGGNNTKDRVFILSNYEIRKYVDDINVYTNCPDETYARCIPTDYATSCGLSSSLYGCCSWWTRTPGEYTRDESYVDSRGIIDFEGFGQHYYGYDDFFGVRPAMYISWD